MKRSSSIKSGDLCALGMPPHHMNFRESDHMKEEALFELEDGPEDAVPQVGREHSRARSEAGSSSWGSECSYHECLQSRDDGLAWVIADLENASSMAWRTLTVKGTATLANLAHLLAHATLGRATVRTGLGAGSALESMTQLRHSFLLCKHPRAAHTDLIVDPNFRDQFTISRADDEFCTFLETVPHLFVGTASMLKASVRVCSEVMGDAMDRANMPRPPWREQAALLSKWAPLHWRDELYLGVTLQDGGSNLPGGNPAAAIVAVTRPGAAPTPASITVHSTKHGSKVVEVTRQQQAAASQQQARPPRVSVVRVKDAPPRTSIVGFRARGTSSGAKAAGAAHAPNAARAQMKELHQMLGVPLPFTPTASSMVSSLAVSSLSDELMAVGRMERKGEGAASKNKDVSMARKAGRSQGGQSQEHTPQGQQLQGAPLPSPQACATLYEVPGKGAVAVPVTCAAAEAAVQASRLAAVGLYRPLDQLLPAIRTVRLGRI